MKSYQLDRKIISGLLIMALAEDLGRGDITSEAVIPEDTRFSAEYTAKAEGVLSGMRLLPWLFELLNSDIKFKALKQDGTRVTPGMTIARVTGSARDILAGERLSLNILQHLSGIATLTERYVKEVRGTGAKIYDTRKTLPGLRMLEKYAVVCGGGYNHRIGLYDAVMIKDNHIAVGARDHISPAEMIRAARKSVGKKVEITVEVADLKQLTEVLPAGPDIILLDNMTPKMLCGAVEMLNASKVKKKPKLEASGGITLKNLARVAATGVDRISIGALTHSARALDISLNVVSIK